MEKFFVSVIEATPRPQSLVWSAMHQCYSNEPVYGCPRTEDDAGRLVVDALLKGHKGHFGPLEHPQITLSCSYFPHSMIAQLTRHRIGCTFDVQSFRYTKISRTVPITDIFYFRKPGEYVTRTGKFTITQEQYDRALSFALGAVDTYCSMLDSGVPGEVARGILPYDYRQHFVMSVNLRSLMHLLDIRHKPDCQLEIQVWSSMVLELFKKWTPEIAHWYIEHRLNKARLAP